MDELAKRFADLAAQFGPQVAQAALDAVRVEAWSHLAASLLGLAVAALMAGLGWFLWRRAAGDWDEDWMVASVILWCLAGVVAAICTWVWVDPWTWTMFTHPELWLARKVFSQ